MKKGFFVLLMAAIAPSVYAQSAVQAPAASQATPSNRADSYFHFSRARLADSEGRFSDSIAEYKEALKVDPNNSTLYSEMAQTYDHNSQTRLAVDTANEAVRINPDNIDAHILLSQIYWKQLVARNAQPDRGTIEQAVHEYEEIIRIDPSDPQAFLQLGLLYQFNKQPEKAEEIYKKHLKVEPGSEEGTLALADLHMKSGDNKGAAALLEDFLKNRPDSDRVTKALGDAYFYQKDFGKAAEYYKKAIALGAADDDPEVEENYAQALFMADKFEDAAAIYQRMLQRNPNDPATLVKLSQIYRSMMNFDKARAALTVADKLVPNNEEIQFNLFLVDRDEGKIEEALTRLSSLAKASEHANGRYTEPEQQNRSIYFSNIAALSSSIGRYDQAVQAYQDLRTVSPQKDIVDVRIIETYREARNIDMANQYLQKALKASPKSRPLLIVSADMTAEKGKVDEGIRILEGLSNGQPDLELIGAMAEIYQRAKKWDDAQNLMEKAIKAFPMNPDVYFMQGAMYEKQKKDGEAEKAFRKSLEFNAESPATLNYLGYMLADRGIKLDEALIMIKKAVDAEPISGAYLDSLGWVYYKMNRLPEAEQYLTKAVRFASTDATMHDHLGDLYNRIGKFPEADAEWQKAIQLATEPREADTIKKKRDQIKNKLPKKQL